MNGTINDRYFEWLYSRIGSVRNRNPMRSYWELARQFYTTEFVWFVPNDDNRAQDGIDLRYEFIEEWGRDDVDQLWLDLECSFLEMFIALSRRLSFESSGTAYEWFWKLMQNLEISTYTDDIYEISIAEEVDEVLQRINYRTYDPSGRGGLFPIRNPSEDQRQVEIWYQMSTYLIEGDYIDHGPKLERLF